MFSLRFAKTTACVLLTGVSTLTAACAAPQGPAGSIASAKPAQPAKTDALDRSEYEDQWQKFHGEAKANYGFTEAQAGQADVVLQSCLARAADQRKQYQEELAKNAKAKEGDAANKAKDQFKAALDKLNDECIGRIGAIASIEQVKKAEAAGFSPPSKKNPTLLPEVGFKAPTFELKGPDGKAVSLESLRGKVVVLHFWATWCGFCKKSIPEIQKLNESLKDKPDAVIYGINCKQRPNNPDPAAFLKEAGCTYNLLLNGDDVATMYQVQGYPTMYVIGRDGKIVHKERGAQADVATRLVPIIEKALAQPAPAKGT